MHPRALYTCLCLGIIEAGGCFVGANPAYTYLELRHLLTVAKVNLLIIELDLLENLLPRLWYSGIKYPLLEYDD